MSETLQCPATGLPRFAKLFVLSVPLLATQAVDGLKRLAHKAGTSQSDELCL
jgi:hypothetical protein